jgi:DNA-binding transcriptional LysR family regulator
MRSLVAAGVGVGLLREALAQEAGAAGEVVCFGEHACTTQLVFAWPEGRDEDPAIQAVLDTLRRIWSLDDAS